jgi:hypothetical protein
MQTVSTLDLATQKEPPKGARKLPQNGSGRPWFASPDDPEEEGDKARCRAKDRKRACRAPQKA